MRVAHPILMGFREEPGTMIGWKWKSRNGIIPGSLPSLEIGAFSNQRFRLQVWVVLIHDSLGYLETQGRKTGPFFFQISKCNEFWYCNVLQQLYRTMWTFIGAVSFLKRRCFLHLVPSKQRSSNAFQLLKSLFFGLGPGLLLSCLALTIHNDVDLKS